MALGLHTCPKHGVEFCCNFPEDIHHWCSKQDFTVEPWIVHEVTAADMLKRVSEVKT